MKSWYEIYRERMNASYRSHLVNKYAQFLEQLHFYQGQTTTEIGCGAGNITRLLREMENPGSRNFHFLTDKCPQMVGLAVENNPTPRCMFSVSDITEMVPDKCDMAHSHGLLEHFDDATIRTIVNNMMWTAPIQLHYVPGARYISPSRGDERLMEPKQWREILSCFKRVNVTTFNDDLDLIIRVERK